MWRRFGVIALAVLAFSFPSAPRLNAGTEVVEPQYAPTPRYSYAPPPPTVVYYAPPPVPVVVYPTVRYYATPVRVFGYQRFHSRRGYCRPRHR